MINEADMVNVIISRGFESVDEAIEAHHQGLAKFTKGDNEMKWEWDRGVLESLEDDELLELYEKKNQQPQQPQQPKKPSTAQRTLTALRFWFGSLKVPKTLELDENQAEYVKQLFLGGSDPMAIGRAVDKMFGRKSFDYFREPDAKGRWVFPTAFDYYDDGLEYIRAAMIALGAIEVRKGNDGKLYDYYKAEHPMVKRVAAAMAVAQVPQSTRG